MRKLTATLCLTVALLFGYAGVSYAGIFGPSNYEDCVLEGMKGVKSDLAARVIISACAGKFPSKKKYTPQSKKPKYQPELDKYGMKICRVMKKFGNWIFVDKKRLAGLKNVWLYEVRFPSGETVILVKPKGKPVVSVFDEVEIEQTCANYHNCKLGLSYSGC